MTVNCLPKRWFLYYLQRGSVYFFYKYVFININKLMINLTVLKWLKWQWNTRHADPSETKKIMNCIFTFRISFVCVKYFLACSKIIYKYFMPPPVKDDKKSFCLNFALFNPLNASNFLWIAYHFHYLFIKINFIYLFYW